MYFPKQAEVLAKLREKNREDYKSEWYAIECQLRAQLRRAKRKFEVWTWVHTGMQRPIREQLRQDVLEGLRLAGYWGATSNEPLPRVRVTQDWFPTHNNMYALRVKVKL